MKIVNIILIAFIFTIIAGFNSCTSLDDTKPFDKFDEATVWSSKGNALVFVNGVYASVTGLYTNYVADEAWTSNVVASDGMSVTREVISRDDDFGYNQFGRIRSCNLIIDKAGSSTVLSDGEKKELIAHGKFLRAMTYYWLARRFGRVIFVDKVLTENETNFALPQTANIAETYNLILKDLDDAFAGLPETAPAGLASKWAAYALKSEAALQAAAYTGDNTFYQKAEEAANAVINSNKFSLEADYEGMFNERARFSPEIILATYRDKSNTVVSSMADMQECIPNVNNDDLKLRGATPLFKQDKVFEDWGRFSPTQNIMDQYLAIDAADPTKAVAWDKTSQYLANITKRNSSYADSADVTGAGSINSIIYNRRDKRLAASIVYDSTEWYGELVTTNRNGNLHRLIKGSLLTSCCTQVTNAYFRKAIYNVAPRPFYNTPTDYHWVIFRLGRVYLNKAEAQLRQNKIAEAVATLNVTRQFHGGLPPSKATTSAVAWEDYKRERRVELFKEKDYYWSLLRWGKYGGDANGGAAPGGKIAELLEKPTFMEINTTRKGYRIEVLAWNQNEVRLFDETRRYLFPIQNSQIVRHGSMTQNPNW
jgi:hypothetical protein